MNNSFFLFIYNLCYTLIRLVLVLLSPLLSPKLNLWIKLRQNNLIFTDISNLNLRSKNLRIWIHASSGEIEYAKGLIRELKLAHPQIQIFVSYSSPSAPRLFKNIENEVTHFFPLGWDTSAENTALIQLIKPEVIIFSRTDFWPNLIYTAHKNKIKLAAIATHIKPTLLSMFWIKTICRDFSLWTFVNSDQEKIKSELAHILPKTKIVHIPDSRFDQVMFRLSQPAKINLSNCKPMITFGSTWPKDDQYLLKQISSIKVSGYSIAWAPHEIDDVPLLIEKITNQSANLKIIELSKYIKTEPKPHFDILIIDTIGVLADVYRYSDYAFVGGSFVKKVHSVMEPLCAHNFVIVGPFFSNSPEACQFLQDGYVISVNYDTPFIEALESFKKMKKNALEEKINKQLGGSQKTAQLISTLCNL